MADATLDSFSSFLPGDVTSIWDSSSRLRLLRVAAPGPACPAPACGTGPPRAIGSSETSSEIRPKRKRFAGQQLVARPVMRGINLRVYFEKRSFAQLAQ